MANGLTTNILYYIFICVHQMKDIHEGLEQHMDWVNLIFIKK